MPKDLATELLALGRFGGPIGVKDCTLTLYTPGTRTVGSENAGTNPTSTDYPATGWIEETESTTLIAGQPVRQKKLVISILGASCDGVPVKDGKITIEDAAGVTATYRIAHVGGDGVGAVYECTCVKT